MKVAMIGCGRLGYPVGLAWRAAGHDVVGYDVSPLPAEISRTRKYPHMEPGCQKLLDAGVVLPMVDTVEEAVAHADIVFVSVQTPHGPEYEGVSRMPETRADFSYVALRAAVWDLVEVAREQRKHITLVVISTVLPGTSERELLPLLTKDNGFVSFVYAPMFIAQSTVVEDAVNPEFVLLGIYKSDSRGVETTKAFFTSMHSAEKLRFMSVASAELTKVAYNVQIGMKILAANSFMEIAHKTGADVDDVTSTLQRATDRLVSPRYMTAGMGDGGGCFVEGSLIQVEDGVRAIDEIEKGDRVLGSDGMYHEVIDTYRRPYKGQVYTIKGRGLSRFTVTGEHPIHVARDCRPFLGNGRREQKNGPVFSPIEQVRADQIKEDCYLLFPQPRDSSKREMWLPPRGKSGPAPRPIVPEGDAYVLVASYYMGEGSVWFDRSKNYLPTRVTFSFNTLTDGDYIAECCEALTRVVPGYPIKINKRNERETCTEVRVDSTQLAKILDHDCGHGYEEKKIPSWILNDDRNSALCLRALFRGDGSSHVDGISFSSVSPHLAHGVSFMLRRHGIASTLAYNPKRTGADGVVHRPAYDLGVNNAVFIPKLAEIVGMPIRHQMQEKQYPNFIFEREGQWYHYVNSVETSEYEGTVYNLNVADVHNYVSVGGTVDNCHPRDQIALSWLAENVDLSYDLFGSMVKAREAQTEWLVDLTLSESIKRGLSIVILGKAYKAGTNLTIGSPAVLFKNILDEIAAVGGVEHWDPHIDPPRTFNRPAVFFVATAHAHFFSVEFLASLPKGSVVVDPWGKVPDIENVKVVRVGRK